MEVQDAVRTAAELMLFLLIGFLALQLLDPPEPRVFVPPLPPQETDTISPNLPSEGMLIVENGTAGPVQELNLSSSYASMEANMFDLVNGQRAINRIGELEWSDELAAVAREHSHNLAKQNEPLTERDLLCYVPLVHHEGFDFGLYHDDRLENRSIYNFASSGENIFLASSWTSRKTFDVDSAECNYDLEQPVGEEEIKKELGNWLDYVENMTRVSWLFTFATRSEIEQSILDGWMQSPGHRENILNSKFTKSGIGIQKANDFFIVTQVFIEEVDCGYLHGPCCVEEGYYPYCYVPLECYSSTCLERNP
jgi:uncharacterized protein YkwD